MRLLAVLTSAMIASLGPVACSSENGTPSVLPMSQGGSTTATGQGGNGQGGNVTTTTTLPSGGTATGGAVGSGGTTLTGGTTSTGGVTAKGGTTSTGGVTAKGGTTSTGGVAAKGGTTSTGGATSTGGVTAKGGTTSTGGVTATGGATGSGGTTSTTTNPPITGSTGFTTRYWDCCKPSCSWTTAVPSCAKDGTTRITDRNAKSGCDSGGSAFECFDFSPWYDSATNLSYGFVAHNGVNCGACFTLQFTGEGHYGANPGATAIKGKQMVVQAINIGGIDSNQFDILIPGGGVGAMTAGCSAQWGNIDIGSTSGGFLTACNNDVTCAKNKCATAFAGKPGLLAGCDWFFGWFAGADNPNIVYKPVTCPSQITQKTGVSG